MNKNTSGVILKFQDDGEDKTAYFQIYVCDGWEFEYVLNRKREAYTIQRGSEEKIIYLEIDDVNCELAKPFLEFYEANPRKVDDIIHSLYEKSLLLPSSLLPSDWRIKECTIFLVFMEDDLR